MPAKTILLVDDDEKHLMLHAMILSHAGFRPITAVVGPPCWTYSIMRARR